MKALSALCLMVCLSLLAPGQSGDAEIADVRVSPKAPNQFMRTIGPRAGRYDVKNGSMVDLIRIAYGFDPDKILGGPSWLEMTRFDIALKVPSNATAETVKPVLQSVLVDRFKLVVHKESRPMPTYALTAGKKLQLKEADGSGDTGCRPQSASSGGPVVSRIMTMGANGVVTAIDLGPGMTIQYQCHNMTMEAFAAGLRGMMGVNVGTNPVQDQTGLKGAWNFDVKWSMQFNGPAADNSGDRISAFEAIDKQLGLKLEQQQIPTPVIVVGSVNDAPTPNPPGVSEALPVIAVPKEFEVAEVKPTDPDFKGSNMRTQPGRFTVQGMPMQALLNRALSTGGAIGFMSSDAVVGVPKWAETERFDITAKVPADAQADLNSTSPMLRALLEDRFKLKTHTEERPLAAYTLVAGKPKMKKADPGSRTHCVRGNAPAGAAPGTTTLTCQNITMSQFADQLQNMGPGLNWPVLDATGIEGSFDFVLTWNQRAGLPIGGGGRGGDAGPAGPDAPSASDPSGGLTLFEAIDKQLGLKLEMQKRPMPVVVIDHLEQKPTDN
jgi:uncharacterized protein (TIGR03435 family)